MSKKNTTMDLSWQSWTEENMRRGCDPEEIQKTLVANGFQNAEIKRVMALHSITNKKNKESTSNNLTPNVLNKSRANYWKLAHLRPFHPIVHEKINCIDEKIMQLYTWDDFLDNEECDQLIKLINKQLRASTVTMSNGDTKFRTSRTSDLSYVENPIVDSVDIKICEALGIQRSYSELIQAQKYMPGQEFKAHTDFFAPNTPEYQEFANEHGQRTWTFMVYLQDTDAGGGTQFVKLGKTFYPKKGQAVIWNNLIPTGQPNQNTLHHGMPVEKGSKIIITKWFRELGEGDLFYPGSEPQLSFWEKTIGKVLEKILVRG